MPVTEPLITDPQINFAVNQRHPKTLDEVVATTLEMKSYWTSAAIRQVTLDEHPTPAAEETVVGAVDRDEAADTSSVSNGCEARGSKHQGNG